MEQERIAVTGASGGIGGGSRYADPPPLFAGGDGTRRGPAGDGRVPAAARADPASVVG